MDSVRYTILLNAIRITASRTALLLQSPNEHIQQEEDMQSDAEHILKSVFGYDSFRPLQKEVIQNVLAGRDTVAVMPTGGGKSLCYQIPALLLPGLTVVVSPLISLMEDQVSQLNAAGVSAAFLNSSLDRDQYFSTVDRIKDGSLKLLYVSPEKLNTKTMSDLLHSPGLTLSCLTIDEAHCISEWGHNFRPDYLEIAHIRKQFPKTVCLALTATATAQVRKDIVNILHLEEPAVLVSSFNRKNIFLEVKQKTDGETQVIDFLREHKDESGIIYCFSRKQVDTLYRLLCKKGFSVLPYHAGLTDEQRRKNQNAFSKGKVDIMVATLAFGMGINKPDVRFILHYSIPKSIEQYYQEIGRAGRDGQNAHALLLFNPSDIHKIRYFFEESANATQAEFLLAQMVSYAQSTQCRRKTLLSYFGEMEFIQGEANCCCDICALGLEKEIPTVSPAETSDQNLTKALKAWRRNLADELNIPPYVIFGDKTLADLSKRKPHSISQLCKCYGIGQVKAERFGSAILRIINDWS